MKIRDPQIIRWLAFFGAILIRLYVFTLRFRYRPLGINHDPALGKVAGHFIYTFWHENILVPCCRYAGKRYHALVSQHADGEITAQALQQLGYKTIRGSSTRGGVQALKKMLATVRESHMIVAADGPRGPRWEVQPGAIYLASRSGLPIIVLALSYERPWRLRSWDRFVIPRPFSAVTMVTSHPINVPPGIGREELEAYRLKVQQVLHEANRRAAELTGFPYETETPPAHRLAA